MIIAFICLIVSFLLDGLCSNIFFLDPVNASLFSTIYVLIAFVVLCPYFYEKKKFFLLAVIFGLLFDIVYTNTFILHVIVFLLLGFCIQFFHSFLANSLFNNILISIGTIFLYYLLTFFFLWISNYNGGMMLSLGKILYSSILMTIIYSTILYWLIRLVLQKMHLKQFK